MSLLLYVLLGLCEKQDVLVLIRRVRLYGCRLFVRLYISHLFILIS